MTSKENIFNYYVKYKIILLGKVKCEILQI